MFVSDNWDSELQIGDYRPDTVNAFNISMAFGAYNQRSGSAVGKLFAKLDFIPALYVVHLEGFEQGQRMPIYLTE